ncbi:MAG: putative metal-dependent hydrolase [Bacteroidetes bacterium]|nr:MAG: putative metal-dependent hydrolase [Bacteroidota bacterium]REK06623.1 MAG: putative metal-dependent hydrolase [Bacteroidota bacterium]REK33389.1 MAG: putative metal-dependent hydrolase [Bacteroidota bacterium]REK49788.1 MAG: putative metal-dependent hydrolase [Bacteroidota bacterium]
MSQTLVDDAVRYPIGKFKTPESYTDDDFRKWIHAIDHLPSALKKAVTGLSDSQLDTPYRDDGWTIRQVVHHLADSHMNSYCRFKLALTEEIPSIRPYFEDRWAKQADAKHAPVDVSLKLLEALHQRWVYFLRSMGPKDWERKFYHPESRKEFELRTILALYAWHGEHHLNHILNLKKKMGWK